MPIISVLTPVHVPGAGYLSQTAECVLAQELPEGWGLEWVVQGNSAKSDIIDSRLPKDERIKVEYNGKELALALNRNLALLRCTGSLVRSLDADDVLLPGALKKQIEIMVKKPTMHWVGTQANDLHSDGSHHPFPADIPFGYITPGFINDWVFENDGNWPIHAGGLMYRAATLRAFGGWGALPFDDDLLLFSSISELFDGWFDEEVTWLYRIHVAQTVKSTLARDWSVPSRSFILQKIEAMRALRLIAQGNPELEDKLNLNARTAGHSRKNK